MKTLILSCNTGQGHNAAGKALLEEFTRRSLPCEMLDTLSLGSRHQRPGQRRLYPRYTTRAVGVRWPLQGWRGPGSPKRKNPFYLANLRYADSLARYIQQNSFDTVLCLHLFPAEALANLRRKRGLTARFYRIATDYTCSPF